MVLPVLRIRLKSASSIAKKGISSLGKVPGDLVCSPCHLILTIESSISQTLEKGTDIMSP